VPVYRVGDLDIPATRPGRNISERAMRHDLFFTCSYRHEHQPRRGRVVQVVWWER
jgi:hypothetical protein